MIHLQEILENAVIVAESRLPGTDRQGGDGLNGYKGISQIMETYFMIW